MMFFQRAILVNSLAVTLVLIGGLIPALAVSTGGDDGDSGDGADSNPVVVCDEGYIYDPVTETCVEVQEGALDDRELYEQGRALALAGHHRNALSILNAIENKNDAMVLTVIGYSIRKLGRFEEGIAYYEQALAMEPDSLDTHEYLGEAYVSIGRDDLAGVQLDWIEAICGNTTCDHYVTLTKFIERAKVWR